MEINELLLFLALVFLPADLLIRFTIIKVESDNDEIRICLDEKASKEQLENSDIEPKGFTEPMRVRAFPIRNKRVNQIVHRRRWLHKPTNKIFAVPLEDIRAEGVRYSKEFVVFL